MTIQLTVRAWISGFAILCLWSGPAQCKEPDGGAATDATAAAKPARSCASPATDRRGNTPNVASSDESSSCDDSGPATADECVNRKCVNEPVVTCPCVDEYAAAVAEYNARSGAPLTAWLRCDDMAAGYGGRIGYATKAAPDPPNWVTVILVAKGRFGYGRGIVRRCEAWTYDGLAGDYGRPPLGEPTHGGHSHLSDGELQACEKLIRATSVCPE